jgi:hypothetical protein
MNSGFFRRASVERPPLPPAPPSPRPAVCRGMEGCRPQPPPAPSHTPWKTLRVFHSPPAPATARDGERTVAQF